MSMLDKQDLCLLYSLHKLRAAPSEDVWTTQVNKSQFESLGYLLQGCMLKVWTPSPGVAWKW